ncbi:hypothetical protein AB3466_06170 [Sphingobacterium thalpophilum]|uniref:hypothetical protein n=1 Tax=Sphingobacterium thalpophilum TaxID=259 RepID=UPI0037DA51A9
MENKIKDKMTFVRATVILMVIVLFSCQGPNRKDHLKTDTAIQDEHNKPRHPSAGVATRRSENEAKDVMLAEDIRFNGKLKRFFTMGEFETVFGNPDSIRLLKDDAPCISIFNTETPHDKYLYKSGSRFENSGDSVAVDEFWFRDGNFIIYKGIRIDAYTTLQDIQQLFPAAVSGRIGMDKEGKLWVITLKEDYEDSSDGQVKMFFRDGKVIFMHWWLPC